MISRQRLTTAICLAAPLLLPIGCRKPEVSIYEVPKQEAKAPAARPQISPTSVASQLAWSPASDWQTLAPTQFRKGNYLYEDEIGSAEITVTSFPGSTGGLLANANRWLRQANLPEIDDAELMQRVNQSNLQSGLNALVVDLKAEDASPDSTRIYAAVVPFEGDSWFFKMSGPFSTVESQISAFDSFLQTVQPAGSSLPATPTPTAANTVSQEELTFDVPLGWKESEGSSMRIASLSVEKEGLPAGDFSITSFPGDTGGTVANVNRWLRQIKLPSWTPEQVRSAARKRENDAGLQFTVFYLKSDEGESERILAAILERGGKSWFFKLRGDALLVDSQIKNFYNLLDSVSFTPNPSA